MKKDFGSILDEWEGKKWDIKEEKPHKASVKDTQVAWLNRYGIKDKDADFKAVAREHVRPEKLPIDSEIDLHGMTSDEAEAALERFFEKAALKGYKKVLIIHGKGNHSKDGPVLQKLVQGFIEKTSCAGKSGKERAINGGSGATWVLIKPSK